ncbi:MAG: DUF1566 domain-containing protein [Candidatus Electrothrix scaldis]|nr:MAG: DUF1566 domain-containing protein [Candidatus Electrothrix sp. GW3-3]
MKKVQVLVFIMNVLLCSFVLPALGEARPGPQNGPPPEAYTACEGKKRGDTAEFTSPFGHVITGTCVAERRRLFLRPDSPPDRRGEARQDVRRGSRRDERQGQGQVVVTPSPQGKPGKYPVVDTGVKTFYGNRSIISAPKRGQRFYGQDARYKGRQPAYRDNRDGTVTDEVTGLMWEKDMGKKMTWAQGMVKARKSTLAGYTDWRVPTIKELYSLILFTGRHGGRRGEDTVPYINTRYFKQPLGNRSAGERIIDAQTWSATRYTGRGMGGGASIFGVNFIDGRIKAYPERHPRSGEEKKLYVRLVRGNKEYGKNLFQDNGDGTISDLATGLMWQQTDDGKARDWEDSLSYAEGLRLAGYTDWRLPNAKELQSIVDYNRSPVATSSPAIDPLFQTSRISAPDGQLQYPYFWTSTNHQGGRRYYEHAVYIAFGRALGDMHGGIIDVHGAGAQRSDPKTGAPDDYPSYFGPQGDMRVVFNYVRCVRNIQ